MRRKAVVQVTVHAGVAAAVEIASDAVLAVIARFVPTRLEVRAGRGAWRGDDVLVAVRSVCVPVDTNWRNTVVRRLSNNLVIVPNARLEIDIPYPIRTLMPAKAPGLQDTAPPGPMDGRVTAGR